MRSDAALPSFVSSRLTGDMACVDRGMSPMSSKRASMLSPFLAAFSTGDSPLKVTRGIPLDCLGGGGGTAGATRVCPACGEADDGAGPAVLGGCAALSPPRADGTCTAMLAGPCPASPDGGTAAACLRCAADGSAATCGRGL